MSKTLLVHYLPRGERSKTKQLVDHFKATAQGKTEIIEHDLIQNPPEMFLRDNLMAYIRRNYMEEKTAENDAILKNFDANVAELKQADHVVLAFPMYNFSVPAVVKAWMDSVVMKNETFSVGEWGMKGLLSGKALVLSTAGAMGYATGGMMEKFDHARTLAREGMEFMGFHAQSIEADGANALPVEEYEEVMKGAKEKIEEVVKEWY